jgi:ankyrin repeat protein
LLLCSAAKQLIEKFPELIDIPKEDGFAALHVAATNNHHEIARLLILSVRIYLFITDHEQFTWLSFLYFIYR